MNANYSPKQATGSKLSDIEEEDDNEAPDLMNDHGVNDMDNRSNDGTLDGTLQSEEGYISQKYNTADITEIREEILEYSRQAKVNTRLWIIKKLQQRYLISAVFCRKAEELVKQCDIRIDNIFEKFDDNQ
eukprot:UN28777